MGAPRIAIRQTYSRKARRGTVLARRIRFAQLALSRPAGAGLPRARWVAELDAVAYPHTTRVAELLANPPSEEQFVHGLQRILGWTA
jgi:hypothetical protein